MRRKRRDTYRLNGDGVKIFLCTLTEIPGESIKSYWRSRGLVIELV